MIYRSFLLQSVVSIPKFFVVVWSGSIPNFFVTLSSKRYLGGISGPGRRRRLRNGTFGLLLSFFGPGIDSIYAHL